MKKRWRTCRHCAARMEFKPRQTLCKKCLKLFGLNPYTTDFASTARGRLARGGDREMDSRCEYP